ncbi:helix-turn-helix domain-containing protein [Cytobacillus solani]|uniref:helix-turn-helix domain-containing protein n=1 Tax=Cytobacillus solani TaxID=1637975 RepID=UPI000700ECF7|nr:helix-turn-helix transcriptional regulator [Cytobacillus solani]
MTVGERLKSLRITQNLSQAEFANSIGIKQSSLSHIEKGTTKPSIDTILAASKEYGVTTDWLLKGQ